MVLDGEVGNSTYASLFGGAHPERYFEMYIAEQQLVAAAVGLQVRGWVPFASTFAAFLSRAYDFIRMAAVSRADIRLVGSHCGVSIGEDGPSQIVTVEDHHPEGGIGDAVLEVFADDASRPRSVTLAVRKLPTSDTPAELLEQVGIDREHTARRGASAARRALDGMSAQA